MKYTMKAGVLYQGNHMLARLKGSCSAQERRVFPADGKLILRATIQTLHDPARKDGDVRLRRYILVDTAGKECAVAKPDYAEGDDPEIVGWPIYRMPSVDHAQFLYHDAAYLLCVENRQSYCMTDKSGNIVVHIFHRGLVGGWNIDADGAFPPELVCGIFICCRYMEHENEFQSV